MSAILIGLVTAFTLAIAYMFAIQDLDAVLTTATGLPVVEIFYQATGSQAAAVVLQSMMMICFFGAGIDLQNTKRPTLAMCRRILGFSGESYSRLNFPMRKVNYQLRAITP